jgi:hypothetical protein
VGQNNADKLKAKTRQSEHDAYPSIIRSQEYEYAAKDDQAYRQVTAGMLMKDHGL